jgi:hypothetical protein
VLIDPSLSEAADKVEAPADAEAVSGKEFSTDGRRWKDEGDKSSSAEKTGMKTKREDDATAQPDGKKARKDEVLHVNVDMSISEDIYDANVNEEETV